MAKDFDDVEMMPEWKKELREMALDEYVPTPLKPLEIFIKQKEYEAKKIAEDVGDHLDEGLIEYCLMETDSPRIRQFYDKYMEISQLAAEEMAGKSAEEILDIFAEKNRCGLEESDFEIMLKYADSVADAQDYQKAMALYKTLMFLFVKKVEPWIRWGNIEYQNNRTKEALAVFTECRNLLDHPLVDLFVARCHIDLDEYDNAKENLERCIASCGDSQTEVKEQALAALELVKPHCSG